MGGTCDDCCRKTFRILIQLAIGVLVVGLLAACGGGGGGSNGSGDTIVQQSITIDGDTSDWVGISPVLNDRQGDEDSRANFEGTDLHQFFMAQDNFFYYFLLTLYDGPPNENGVLYFFVANQIAGVPDTDGDFESLVSASNGTWSVRVGTRDQNGYPTATYGQYNQCFVSIGADCIEWRVPKIAMGDLNNKFVRVYIHNTPLGAAVSDSQDVTIGIKESGNSSQANNIAQGEWTGATQEGNFIRFTVAGNAVTEFSITLNGTTATNMVPGTINDQHMFISSGIFNIIGSFQSDTYCMGLSGNSMWDAQPVSATQNDLVTCTAGCQTMQWQIPSETGPVNRNESCTREYHGSEYTDTCVGTMTYDNSGITYPYTTVINWADCTINVDVDGVGTCADDAILYADDCDT